MKNALKFRVSSALKDIIGKDLITDDFIAVFELVKNSFDAYASQVDIYFENLNQPNSKITIKDNGKGMNKADLENKWLFVAYSAKTEGTEDIGYDYRNDINSKRPYAGAKGIGRFSCDKLGKYLYMETTKDEVNANTEVLITNWENFETDIKAEFIDIAILHETLKNSTYDVKHGTVLVISELRDNWDRNKLLRLKDSLAKLINPNISAGSEGFRINIHALEEKEKDVEIISKNGNDPFNQRQVVNGEVKNFIFDELGLKTTKIVASISDNRKHISTALFDGGTLIYKIKEDNLLSNINDVKITLYYLNRSAKVTFAKRMGLATVRFGHIFLYKNGFRIFPFGEPQEDPLKINVRKSRKNNSRLGTGELIGQIEIFGENPGFKETSSRGDGLIKNDSYFELEKFLLLVLERLEKYVIEVQRWGLSIEDSEVNQDMRERMAELISEITGSNAITAFEIPKNFIELITHAHTERPESVINNLNRIAFRTNDTELINIAKNVSIVLEQIQIARKESDEEAQRERINLQKATSELAEKETENIFLKAIKSQDLNEVVSFMHSIGISASTIENYLNTIYQKLTRGLTVTQDELKRAIEVVSFENRKIISITRFSTKANFKLYAEDVRLNLIEFISEYAKNILQPLRFEDITINIYDNYNGIYFKEFKPIEISILIDNLVSNSIRAKANKFDIIFQKDSEGRLNIIFSDDGNGIKDENLNKIFNFGFTTTSGSGLGLYHIKQIVDKLGVHVLVNNKILKGVQFILIFQ
jgi:signal transduction histidine kinase